MNIPNNIRSYTAGLMDGEGTVTLINHKKNENRSPQVSITNTSRPIIDFLADTYGGSVCVRKKTEDHHKQAWIWKLTYTPAIEFLKVVLPYMLDPGKLRRGKMIINEFERLTSRNGKYTKEMMLAKKSFEERFFADEEHDAGIQDGR